MPCCKLVVVSLLLASGSSLHAQTGKADLRYRAPLPASITYVTIDSSQVTMSGLPMGDMTTTSFSRAVSELRFTPVEDGFDVTAVLKELQGSRGTPMGSMPISATNVPSSTIRITAAGPDPVAVAEADAGLGTSSAVGATPGNTTGSAKARSGLLALPGRELALGETWTDTVRLTPELEDVTAEIVVVTHGTYAADTVVNGRTLNVLRITNETNMTMTGTMRGMKMTQHATTASEERVLWDSSQHYPTSRDAAGRIRTEMTVVELGMTTMMTGTTRSITTAHMEQ
jgi:hypothetical protein